MHGPRAFAPLLVGLCLASAGCRDDSAAPKEVAEAKGVVSESVARPATGVEASRVPEVTAANPLRPAAFRLTVAADPLRVGFDTAGWEQEVLARESDRGAAALWREEGGSFRLGKDDIALLPPTNHVHMEVYNLLEEPTSEFRRFGDLRQLEETPVLAIAIEPEVAMSVVHDLVLTATRVGISEIDLLLGTPAGPGRIRLWVPPLGQRPGPCYLTTVTVVKNQAFVSLATLGSVGELDHRALLMQGRGLPEISPHLTNRRMVLAPDRTCPTVSARSGELDGDALVERLGELGELEEKNPAAEGACPETRIAVESATSWGEAARWMAKLSLVGHSLLLIPEQEGYTACTPGVRPGDRGAVGAPEASPRPPEGGRSTVRLGSLEVEGTLEPQLIHRIVRAHLRTLQWCGDESRKVSAFPKYSAEVRFTVTKRGRVKRGAQLSGSPAAPSALESCLKKSFERMTFPSQAGETTVVYPLVFE